MTGRAARCAGALALLLLLWPGVPRSEPARDAAPADARAILKDCFARRYEVAMTSKIQLIMRSSQGGERRRIFHAASKLIDDRVHSIGRLVWPEYLRGMAILTIESRERFHDSFVYMPTLDKVRRVSSAQRGDSFLGSDITYADLERLRAEDFEPERLEAGERDDEATWIVFSRPKRPQHYRGIEFTVAQSDGALLGVRFWRVVPGDPYRVMTIERRHIMEKGPWRVPTQLRVANHRRKTSTEVLFTELQIDPVIDDRVFTVATLERDNPIPVILE